MIDSSVSSPSSNASVITLCHLVWLFFSLWLMPSAAAPLAWGYPGNPGPSTSQETAFAQRIERAAEGIRQQLRTSPVCRDYFHQLGVDVDAWLDTNQPPYVIPRRLHTVQRNEGGPICGAAQATPPFRFLFIDWHCFPRPRLCDLASLILHELGHLARQDTEDHEPRAFFMACRLSSCIDPGRYR